MAKDILVVQVGTDERPASEIDLKWVEKRVKKALKASGDSDTVVLALHHAVNMYKVSALYSSDAALQETIQLLDRSLITPEEAKKRLGL